MLISPSYCIINLFIFFKIVQSRARIFIAPHAPARDAPFFKTESVTACLEAQERKNEQKGYKT
jgi:hypothetical protein